ncbi:sulfur carrier protein ThiS [Nocardioides immobilis]|uniref:Sulfur carrier protein ThiS n=1 Tax=Nocardioides immobilis TaxID=2049295 RepID=A0A417XUW0_9ACTN|nr:sulfur carrier protein ThiS [Nocardioides immobilis]RHW24274.1 sulfur carrier protein ThiS [Nocardioides immobilis]
MLITVNGQPTELAGATVADLLTARMDDPRPNGIAVAVNDEVVPRDDWPRWPLKAGDTVEIVTAVQGG